MTREAAERGSAKGTAHAMRAAAIRLARERAALESEPMQAYGCVDWFRYDAMPPPQAANRDAPPAVLVQEGAEQAA